MARIFTVLKIAVLLGLTSAWLQTGSCATTRDTNEPSNATQRFTEVGEIVGPSGRIFVTSVGGISIVTATGDTYSLTIPTSVRGGGTLWNGGGLADKRVEVDQGAQTTSFRATLVDNALPAPIPVRFELALTREGKVRIKLRFESEEPISKLLSLSHVFFYIQRREAIGSEVSVNGTRFAIMEGPTNEQVVNLRSATATRDLEFFSADPYRTVKISSVQAAEVSVRDENVSQWQTLGARFSPIGNQIVFDVELPSKFAPNSAETYASIDFYAAEKIHLPQYGLSRNLVQNPSFENGFQYWNFGNLGNVMASRYKDNYEIETSDCRSGRKCLKILGEKAQTPSLMATFAIPVNAGQTYTLSFYAKGDRSKLQLMTSIFPSTFTVGLSWKGFEITQNWQRYSYSFKAPSGALSVQFGISNPNDDVVGWLDDVQLETGVLTEYTQKSIELVLLTDHRDNLSKPDEPINARWQISGKPGAQGFLSVSLRDMFGTEINKRRTRFKIGADGTAIVKQPWLKKLDRGLYTQEAIATTEDGLSLREYGRLAIVPPADPTVKHHRLFAMGGTLTRQGSWKRRLANQAYYGIGSAMNFDPVPHAMLALMAEYQITNVSSIFDSGDHVDQIKLVAGWSGAPSDLAVIEQFAYAKAKTYPEIKYWKLVNEPNSRLANDGVAMKQWIVALTAAHKGIKRANPDAQVLSIDPANMAPTSGIPMLDAYMAAGGEAITNIIAIHPYRQRPESPDMDADISALYAMLKQHNYNGKIWFTEGGGHLGLHIPALSLDVHRSLSDEDNGGEWRIGNFSYDIGQGEQYAAAYAIRAWLMGLKYGDRIEQQVDWYYRAATIDFDATPEVRAVALNALKSLLGNSDFVQDIALSEGFRCYLFKDHKNRPVAVLWRHTIGNEGDENSPTISVNEIIADVEIFNMLGTKIRPNKVGRLGISSNPVYFLGKPGSTQKLAAALSNKSTIDSLKSIMTEGRAREFRPN